MSKRGKLELSHPLSNYIKYDFVKWETCLQLIDKIVFPFGDFNSQIRIPASYPVYLASFII